MSSDLSKQESELYDRSIRTWGLEAQRRIKGASVCVLGLRGAAVEVVKNIVLAGVGHVTLVDDRVVTHEDFAVNFFLSRESVGSNVAEASAAGVRALNPLVKVSVLAQSPEGFDSFSDFSDVCASELPFPTLLALSDACRTSGARFFAVSVMGLFAFCFEDILTHEYVHEITKPPKNADDEKTTETTKHREEFVGLREAFVDTPVAAIKAAVGKRKTGQRQLATLLTLKLLFEDGGRAASEDESVLLARRAQLLDDNKDTVCADDIPEAHMLQLLRGRGRATAAVCSILGGVLGQEILTAVSAKGHPFKNVALFDVLDSRVSVYDLKKKR